ncbi:MAG: hypothetical protein MZU79_08745 [Anaerotruncus sp.]|nr:hypothetical protein [Anaerotruncus sp.]
MEAGTSRHRAEADGEGVLVKEYQGASLYDMVHNLSDDLVFVLTGEQGIASTRIAYIVRNAEEWKLVVKTIDPRSSTSHARHPGYHDTRLEPPGRPHCLHFLQGRHW